jgi:ankyrin repeat protein
VSLSKLEMAFIRGQKEKVIELVEAGADPRIKNARGENGLWFAIHRMPALISFMVDKGCDPNGRNAEGITPLDYALTLPLPAVPGTLEALLEAGASLEEPSPDHLGTPVLPLSRALRHFPKAVPLLLSWGAPTVAALSGPNDGIQPLMWAARRHPELVQALIDAGADINVTDREGYTVLDWARDDRTGESLKILEPYFERLALEDSLPGGTTPGKVKRI